MKKIALLLPLLICSLVFASCNTDETDTAPPDTSLAGSVYMEGYTILEAQGTYNGIAFNNIQPKQCFLDVWEVSDTEIYIYAIIVADGTTFRVQIPIIPLTGKTYDVAFDHTFSDAFINFNESKYSAVAGSVKGWIRKKSTDDSAKSANYAKSRTTLAQYDYDCEINIECVIDGNLLTLKITDVGEIK